MSAVLTGLLLSSAVLLPAGRTEVVATDTGDAMLFTVEETTNLLSRIFGCGVPVVRRPTPGFAHLVLGTNEFASAAGVGLADVPEDGFRVKTAEDSVYVVGADDPAPRGKNRVVPRKRATGTLFGVYHVLETFAGARFYFPGELGTVLPRRKVLEIPETDALERPDFPIRRNGAGFVANTRSWYEEGLSEWESCERGRLQNMRLRMSGRTIPCSHGQNGGCFDERFAKTHPEYFNLRKDGTRWIGNAGGDNKPNQLCQSSGIWDELYLDALSYFRGEDASARGLRRWGPQADRRMYYDIMPQDGMKPCHCAQCQAAYARAGKDSWAERLVWEGTARVARRLKEAGVPGSVVQMAYHTYRHVPDVELPDNVLVMVAHRGPWENAKLLERNCREIIRGWTRKLGHKVWLWTYVGKAGQLAGVRHIPLSTPRAMGRYWKAMRGIIFGGYSEEETDRYLQHYLDLYVFAKVCWNLETDVEALLAEHNRLMFGAAAKPMDMVIRIMEECWLRIASNTEDTALGPSIKAPTEEQLYTKYYGPKVIARLDALYAEAASLVPAGSLEARRIALYRDEFYAVIRQRANDYHESSDVPRWRKFVEEHPELIVKGRFVRRSGTAEMDADGRGFSLAADPEKEFSTVSARMPSFEYGKRYRLAWFIRAEDVKAADKWGGLIATFRRGNDFKEDALRAPRSGSIVGTTDWIRQTIEFTPAENVKESGRFTQELNFNIVRATGRFRVRDITVEEIR